MYSGIINVYGDTICIVRGISKMLIIQSYSSGTYDMPLVINIGNPFGLGIDFTVTNKSINSA